MANVILPESDELSIQSENHKCICDHLVNSSLKNDLPVDLALDDKGTDQLIISSSICILYFSAESVASKVRVSRVFKH